MKRSRYSAVMSMWSGFANQSSERRRFFGVVGVLMQVSSASRRRGPPGAALRVMGRSWAASVAGGQTATQFVLDMDADDVVKVLFGGEAERDGAVRLEAGRPATDHTLDAFIRH